MGSEGGSVGSEGGSVGSEGSVGSKEVLSSDVSSLTSWTSVQKYKLL